MNAHHAPDELLYTLRGAQERFENALSAASRAAGELHVETLSADGSVAVGLRGDYRVDSVRVDERTYGQQDAEGLRAAILDAYRRAVLELSRRQRLTILGTVLPVEQEEL